MRSRDSELDRRMEAFHQETEEIQRCMAEYRARYERSHQYMESLRQPGSSWTALVRQQADLARADGEHIRRVDEFEGLRLPEPEPVPGAGAGVEAEDPDEPDSSDDEEDPEEDPEEDGDEEDDQVVPMAGVFEFGAGIEDDEDDEIGLQFHLGDDEDPQDFGLHDDEDDLEDEVDYGSDHSTIDSE